LSAALINSSADLASRAGVRQRIKKMITGVLMIVPLQLAILFGSVFPAAMVVSSFAVPTPQTGGGGFTVREPNVYSPQFYSDKIDFVATLVDLPGAMNKQSYWEFSYQLFFVPEEKYYEALQRLPQGPSNPTPEQFPGKILLAEGHAKKTSLGTLKLRTIALTGVAFKQKVPDAQRTKFSYLMTAYSVKIFDAELNTTVYRSGIFLVEPYEMSSSDQKQAIARKTYYASFGVTPDGTLNRSQRAPKTSTSASK
jgi:hypothetical protein